MNEEVQDGLSADDYAVIEQINVEDNPAVRSCKDECLYIKREIEQLNSMGMYDAADSKYDHLHDAEARTAEVILQAQVEEYKRLKAEAAQNSV